MSRKSIFQKLSLLVSAGAVSGLVACGGGGGSGSGGTIYYPYETVYGDICTTSEPTPGCTFFSDDGSRIDVYEDPDHDYFGNGVDDMYLVVFDSTGQYATIYDEFGDVSDFDVHISEFAGWIGGATIGVGTTGLFWEDVTNGEYFLGANGVLYSANEFESNYGQAINNKGAGKAVDTNFAALSSEANKKLVKLGAEKLMAEYKLPEDKAMAVAQTLNRFGVAYEKRGYTTTTDLEVAMKGTFATDFKTALAAVKDLQGGKTAKMKNLTNRTAAALGLKPHQAKDFIKGMYSKALANYGYDAKSLDW